MAARGRSPFRAGPEANYPGSVQVLVLSGVMDAPRQYSEELKSELGFYPTWLPTDPIEIGALGTFVRGVFRKEGTLADLGIDVVLKTNPTKRSFVSQRGLSLQLATSGTATAQPLNAELGVEFKARRAYAWAFAASGAQLVETENILHVSSEVLDRRRAGLWRDEWRVVTEVQHVHVLNIVVAKSEALKGRVTAKGSISSPIDVLLSEDVSYEFDAESAFLVQNARGTTPLFGVRSVRGIFDKRLRPIARAESSEEALGLHADLDAEMFPT